MERNRALREFKDGKLKLGLGDLIPVSFSFKILNQSLGQFSVECPKASRLTSSIHKDVLTNRLAGQTEEL